MILLSLFGALALLLVFLGASAHLTNPFNRLTIIRLPYRIKRLAPLKVDDATGSFQVRTGPLWRWWAILKCGLHILHTRYGGSRRSSASTVQGVIASIHEQRFRPDKLLLISGDHFNGLFVRNLGVFYYPMLDVRIKSPAADWQNRQIVYAQSVAYALATFRVRPVPTTTIVETGPYSATCVNFYAYPSDTVYGILYALAALNGIEAAAPGDYARARQALQTQEVGESLLATYLPTLKRLYAHYRETVYDDASGLVDREVHLSGAKDITRRRSAFYDNVVFWKTTQLAMRMGIIAQDTRFLDELKSRILQTFWLTGPGHFLEDLSDEGTRNKYYSSEWLIVLATGFLDPALAREQNYFARCIEYIHANDLDMPLPLRYHADRRAHRQFLAVRLAVASYGGDAIWSFWGMEYLKCLLMLYEHTGDTSLLKRADAHIAAYEAAMLEQGGFPEVFDGRRRLLQTPLYRGIRQTGWVIGFEQVKAMRQALR